MKTRNLTLILLALLAAALPAAAAPPPDYRPWGDLLSKYYDPAKGMSYKALKAQDQATLDNLRRQMAAVDVQLLSRQDQFAYWINLYNISVVGIVVDNYPVASIRDLSTDPVIRLNIFKKDLVDTRRGKLSLNDIENEKLRNGFKDVRIHFAINCAAESCPALRTEPYVGDRIQQQLEDQTRKFLNGPQGVRLEKRGGGLILHLTKVMSWFEKDFYRWGGGTMTFLLNYVSPDKRKQMVAAGNQIDVKYDDYSWKLNDNSQ